MPDLKMLDLFSGIGGFSLAGKWAGFETVGFCEIDPFCQKVLAKNFPGVPIVFDIKNLTLTTHIDLITGGFPCQPFSVAGKKKGKNDTRYLWPEFYRIIRESNPTWVVAENVAGIVEMELQQVYLDLEKAGYEVESFIIPASAAGAPHRRERVWIVANALRKRCSARFHHSKKINLSNDWQRNIERIQTHWKELLPQSWQTFNVQDWMRPITNPHSIECDQKQTYQESITKRSEWPHDIGATRRDSTLTTWQENESPIPGMDDGIPNGVDRNKALGNAIVPQVVYPILAMIRELEMRAQ